MKRLTQSLLLLAGAMPVLAWAQCEYEYEIDTTRDLTDSSLLQVRAQAGDLWVRGVSGDQLRVRARICASEADWAVADRLVIRDGESPQVAVKAPKLGSQWTWRAKDYFYVDLTLEVPAGLRLDIEDSSGDVELLNTGPVAIEDSSGDLRINGVTGAVNIRDSSGDIEVMEIVGDVTIPNDSSGDIAISEVTGAVSVRDSSGDIRFADITGNVTVVNDSSGAIFGRDINGSVEIAQDSSGDIRFEDVTQDFMVVSDSSGDIRANRIGGDFTVQNDSSGGISHREVRGQVSIPGD